MSQEHKWMEDWRRNPANGKQAASDRLMLPFCVMLVLGLVCLAIVRPLQSSKTAQSAESDPVSLSKATKAAKSPPSSARQVSLASRFSEMFSTADVRQSTTAQKIIKLFQTGEVAPLREIPQNELDQFAEFVAARMSLDEMASALEQHLGLPRHYTLENKDGKSAISGLLNAALGRKDMSAVSRSNLIFTDQCDPDGRIAGHIHSIPQDAKRVYAVFENTGRLQGLTHVLAIWRNPAEDRILFSQCEPLRPATQYNYVWVQPASSMPAGSYQLDLCDPRNNSLILASRGFSVQ